MKAGGGVGDYGEALTVQEFAARVGLSYFTVSRKIKRGEIPAHRFGGAIRIFLGEVLASSRIKPAWEKAGGR